MSFGWMDAAITVMVIAGVLALMWSVRRLAGRFGISAEMQRKLVHVATGLTALTFPLIFSNPLPVFVLMACAIVVMLLLRSRFVAGRGIGSVLHDVQRQSWGEIYLALAIAILFFRSEFQPVLYVLPILVITLSDTASALVGTAYGKMRFAVEDGMKSLEGVTAFFVVTWLCTMITLLLMTDIARLNIIVLSMLIAAFCALVEADSWRGLDNLFVPVGAHLLLARHFHTDPMALVLIAAVFIAITFVVIEFASILRITRHAARSYCIMFFLLLAVIEPQNAVLPLVTIATHILARTWLPCRSERPDLDLLAVATCVGLVWLLAGETIGITVINLFNLTFAGVAVIFSGLAYRGMANEGTGLLRMLSLQTGLLASLATAFAIGAICLWVIAVNPDDAMWYEPAWPPILIALGVAALAVHFKPDFFLKQRSVRAFGVALAVPVIFYLSDGAFA